MPTPFKFHSHPHDTHSPAVDSAYLMMANEFFTDEYSPTTRPELARIMVDSDLDRAIELDPQIVTAVQSFEGSNIVCGALMFSHKPSVLARHPIHYLVVDEAFRGMGLGAELLKNGELQMAKNGLYRVVLHARRGTEDFYLKHGYTKLTQNKWDKRFIKNLSPIISLAG